MSPHWHCAHSCVIYPCWWSRFQVRNVPKNSGANIYCKYHEEASSSQACKPNFTWFSHRAEVNVMSWFFKDILCDYCNKTVEKWHFNAERYILCYIFCWLVYLHPPKCFLTMFKLGMGRFGQKFMLKWLWFTILSW